MTKRKDNPRKTGCNSIQGVNKKKRTGTTSQFFGVFWNTEKRKWVAKMSVNYEQKYVGFYDDEKEAGIAYLKAAIAQWGPETRMADQIKLGLATLADQIGKYADAVNVATNTIMEFYSKITGKSIDEIKSIINENANHEQQIQQGAF